MIEAVEVLIRQPGHPDRVVRLQDGATRMGRGEDNELVLSDVGVSRRHAQITVHRGEVSIEDLGSGNGTYFNGYRIQKQVLRSGDEVVIDPFVLQFRITGQDRTVTLPTPQADAAPARLEVVVGTGMAGSSYPITAKGLGIGRSEDREVVIPDPAASRHHCSILLQGNEYILRDMGSANGVFVNAVRVRECTLSDGDLIRIGNTEMRFVRYESASGDTTTQVVPNEVWNAAAGDPAFRQQQQTVLPREAPQRQTRGRGGLIATVLALLVGLAGLGLAVVAIVVAVLIYLSSDEPIPSLAAHPPRWKIQVQSGLPAATANDLFDAGVAKMRDGDRKAALQDFYRVLEVDPGNSSAERFAFAAGELLVMDTLQKGLESAVAAKKQRESERDALLREWRRGGRGAKDAAAALESSFREDPMVIEAMGWDPAPAVAELEAKAKEGAELLAELKYVDAAARYQQVLAASQDPSLRKTAAAGLKVSQREIARPRSGTWTEAVMSEATGDMTTATSRFQELASADPANASARLHLARMK